MKIEDVLWEFQDSFPTYINHEVEPYEEGGAKGFALTARTPDSKDSRYVAFTFPNLISMPNGMAEVVESRCLRMALREFGEVKS